MLILVFYSRKTKSILLEFFVSVCKIQPNIIHSWTVHDNAYVGIIGSFYVKKIYGSVEALDGTMI